MAGIIGQFIALLAFLLFGSWRAAVVLALVGAGLARGGGAWLHGVVPDMLREGKPPTPEQMAAAAPVLFGPHGVQNGGASLSFAWELMLENLAYTCTRGRKNCLTDKIYGSGPLTLGRSSGRRLVITPAAAAVIVPIGRPNLGDARHLRRSRPRRR